MFGLLNDLAKAAVGVVVHTPLAVVADVVTVGGLSTDKKTTYTGDAISKVFENVEKAVK
jgi:hypothetical protein